VQNGVRICAVDLNINDSLAVCVILESDGTVVAVKFIRGGEKLHDRRKRLLGKIAVKRGQTGILNLHEQDNKHLWEKIRAIDDYEAHRVSRRIVDFAMEHGASIIVFEHLKKYVPQKGKYSTKANQKRSYWLRGRIYEYTRYKAWQESILTCLVNPHNTSRVCYGCGNEVTRYDREPKGYRPGAPLFACSCGKRGNADFNAAVNIGKRLLSRHLKPSGKPGGVPAVQEAG
jgi:IS605 OrfB family transposase